MAQRTSRQVNSVTVGAKCTQLWATYKYTQPTPTLKPVFHPLRTVVQRVRDAITTCTWVPLHFLSQRPTFTANLSLFHLRSKNTRQPDYAASSMYALSSPATKLCHTCWQLILLNNVLPSFVLVNYYVILSIYAIFMFGRQKWVRKKKKFSSYTYEDQ